MLWKLADNVKYEEDCEVRGCGKGSPLGSGGFQSGFRRPRAALSAPIAASAAASPPGAAAVPARRPPLCFFLPFSLGGANFYFHIFIFYCYRVF